MALRQVISCVRTGGAHVTHKRPPQRVVSAVCTSVRDLHSTMASASVAEAQVEEKKYVSRHDWNKLTKDYGKPAKQMVAVDVEIQTIALGSRSLAEQGSKYSRKLREQNRLPGVLYGPGRDGDKSRLMVTVCRWEIEKQIRRLGDSLESTVFDVVVDGIYKQRVILRDLDRNPGTAVPLAINFLRYRPGYPVRVPVCFINEDLCTPIKRGGMLLSINRFIPVTCKGETIPEMLMADLSNAMSGEKIDLKRVVFPPGVTPHDIPPQFFLGVVKGKNAVDAAATKEDTEEED